MSSIPISGNIDYAAMSDGFLRMPMYIMRSYSKKYIDFSQM
jgi:hypothetical protein